MLGVRGPVAEAAAGQESAARAGVRRRHLSISHDKGASAAMVVAEG